MNEPTRRRFIENSLLATAAATVAWQGPIGCGTARAQAGSTAASSLELGLVTYMWGADWDLPTLIDNLKKTGFAGVELRTTHKHGVEVSLNEQQRNDVKKRFEDANIVLVGLGSICEYHSPDEKVLRKSIEDTKAWVKLAHDCGASGVKVRPNDLPKDVPVEKTIEQIGKSLDECAAFGADYGVEIRLEIHGPGTQEIPVIERIMEVSRHPNSTLCWNCNDADLKGEGLAANFALVRDRFGKTIHIHDLISHYPWREFFALLKETNYQGWTLLEEGATSDPLRVMKYYRKVWETLAY
jgi:sugar phosphate isomerase/epimerase